MPGRAGSVNSAHFMQELGRMAAAKPFLFVRGAVSDPGLADEFDMKAFEASDTENAMIASPKGIFRNFEAWRAEIYKYGHAIIHDKTIVVDPFSEDCVVITGSHNLGYRASYNNDENMLVITGDRGVAPPMPLTLWTSLNTIVRDGSTLTISPPTTTLGRTLIGKPSTSQTPSRVCRAAVLGFRRQAHSSAGAKSKAERSGKKLSQQQPKPRRKPQLPGGPSRRQVPPLRANPAQGKRQWGQRGFARSPRHPGNELSSNPKKSRRRSEFRQQYPRLWSKFLSQQATQGPKSKVVASRRIEFCNHSLAVRKSKREETKYILTSQ